MDAYYLVHNIDHRFVEPSPGIQAKVYEAMCKHNYSDEIVAKDFVARMRRFALLPQPDDGVLLAMMARLKTVSAECPRYLLVSMVKAWANAWCTARRMGSSQNCPFCDAGWL